MKFTKLLEILKNYKGDGEDYTRFWEEVGNGNSGEIFGKSEVYEIYSLELKKEARSLVLNADMGDGVFCQGGFSKVGKEVDGKWYEYEKGEGDRPDKFEIKDIKPEELEKRKRDREQIKKDRQQIEKDKEKETKSPEKSPSGKKKCAECGKEIAQIGGNASIGQLGSEKGRLYFCADNNDCIGKYCSRKENQRNKENNNLPEEKCTECGETNESKDGYREYFIIDGKNYCSACLDKRPKKSETELEQIRLEELKNKQICQERTKLNSLKSKLQKSTNSAEKKALQTEIKATENHIKALENKDKSKNNSNQNQPPSEGYGKLIFGGGIIFSALIGLIIIIKIRGRRKKLVRK